MKKYEDLQNQYDTIFNTISEQNDVRIDLDNIAWKAKLHLKQIELLEKYGLDVGEIYNLDYIGLNSNNYYNNQYMKIHSIGGDSVYKISYPDIKYDMSKKVEVLDICFSSGAYIFGEYYNLDLFRRFFVELITYKPLYMDSKNSHLYFALDNAKDIFNDFGEIVMKYKALYKKERLEQQI